jgi:hypothetical protein
MARGTGNQAYLGGISMMLIQSDVCSACGSVHPPRALGLVSASKNACPLAAVGNRPILTSPSDFGGSSTPPLPQLPLPPREMIQLPRLPSPITARKTSSLNVPWPMPSHVEEYL